MLRGWRYSHANYIATAGLASTTIYVRSSIWCNTLCSSDASRLTNYLARAFALDSPPRPTASPSYWAQ